MRRVSALLLALVMGLGLLSACAPKRTAPPPVARGTAVTIHYHRDQGDYSGWDLWVWPDGKEGKGYSLSEKDDFGVKATISLPDRWDKVGFIVRKGGDSWTSKDVEKDRFIAIKGGIAEIWVVEGEEAFATDAANISTSPRIRAAYLDSRRTICVILSQPMELKGSGSEGFRINPSKRIESVADGRQANVGLIGYEFVDNNTQIRFVLVPGLLGLRKSAADGSANVYISGTFNAWGGTAGGSFTPAPEWKMRWNASSGRYELGAPVGSAKGQVPMVGSEFKFTEDRFGGQEWYPSVNVPIVAGIGKATKEVLITLAEDADVTIEYQLVHDTMGKAPVVGRGVLDDPVFVYTGSDLGQTYSPTRTHFRLWAPTAAGMDVLIYETSEGGTGTAHPAARDVGGTWVAEIVGDLRGKYYTYRLNTGSATMEVMDPYATGSGVNGNRALVFDPRETDPPGFREHPRPPFQKPTDAIIYEMHVRDLSTAANSGISHKGKFLGFTEIGTTGPNGVKTGIDHIKELGATHVHLLPSFDYASVDEKRSDQFNWGYDPKNFDLPEGSYATDPDGTARINEFKRMVQSLHTAGIRVVMDVVFNHTFQGASPFEAIAPYYYYRWDASGRMSNGSGTGNETASERPMMRKFMVDSVVYWANEFKVDGFRFDLMALHDRETMQQVRAALDGVDPSIITYGEPWTGGISTLDPELRMTKGAQKGTRIAVFNDNLRNAIKGDNDGVVRGFATGAGLQQQNIQRGVVGAIDYGPGLSDFTQDPLESVNYVSAHDNLTLWDKIGTSNRDDSEQDRVKMDLLSQAIVFTSQGIPFMQGGEEMLRTKGMNHNSYNAPDSVNQLDWSRKSKYDQVFRYCQGLIALRKAHPAFRLSTAEAVRQSLVFLDNVPPGTVAFRLKDNAGGDSWQQIVVVYNPNREEVALSLPLPGPWVVAVSGLDIGAPAAGTGPVSGSAKVPPLTMMVLYQ